MRLRGDALLEPGTAARPTCPSKDWFSEGRPAIVSRPRSRTLWGRQRSTCVLLLATHHVTVAHSYFRDSNVRADRSTLPELDAGLMNPGVSLPAGGARQDAQTRTRCVTPALLHVVRYPMQSRVAAKNNFCSFGVSMSYQ